MTGYLLPLTCGNCGAECEHLASGKSLGTEASAIAQCTGCRREWHVIVHMRPGVTKPETLRRYKYREKARANGLAG